MHLSRRIALVALLAAAAARPAGAEERERPADPDPSFVMVPAGGLTFDVAFSPKGAGNQAVVVGAGLGFLDTPRYRGDLRLRVGLLKTQDAVTQGIGPGPLGSPQEVTYNGTCWGADVAWAWRWWRLETWGALGWIWFTAKLDDPGIASPMAVTDEFDTVSFGAGIRFLVGARSYLGLELLTTPTVRSRMNWLSPRPELGGPSLFLSYVYRLGESTTRVEVRREPEANAAPTPVAAPAAPASIASGPALPLAAVEATPPPAVAVSPPDAAIAEPTPPAPPTPFLPGLCAPGHVPAFEVRLARAYRCLSNPVAGGFTCAPRYVEGRTVGLAACERACRRGAESCAAPVSPEGAACGRCVEECGAATVWVECSAANGGTANPDRTCTLTAKRWGLEDEAVRATRCIPVEELDAER